MTTTTPTPARAIAVDPFPAGNPDDPNSDAFRALYAIAKREGDRRFGSECAHEHVTNGLCANCLREVIS